MAVGGINLRTGRRSNFNKCYYWNRKDKDVDKEEYAHSNKANGVFYAKEVAPKTNGKDIVNGSFMFDRNQTTIQTNDKVNIESGDIIKYQNELWRVVDVQSKVYRNQTQFISKPDTITYLQLVR